MERAYYESYQEKDKMLLKVLDENGNISNMEATKKEVHDKHLWHQEVAIFIISNDGKILLQKRSNNVNYNNGKWGMIANHVGANQSLMDALLQKAEEEIRYNINVSDIRYLTCLKRDEEREKRFTYFYYIKTDINIEDLHLNEYLATDIKWFDFSELKEMMLSDSEEVVFKRTPEYISIFGELSKIIKKDNTSKDLKKQEFIIINSSDGCFFPGIIQRSDKKTDKLLIFIHGSGGNFFKETIYNDIYKEAVYNDIDFMAVNNRGSEQCVRIHRNINGISEVFKGGSMYENFDDSIYDVEAAVEYAKSEGYKDICLIGHSLGTVKVQYYINMIGDVNKVILISPVDFINRFRSRVNDKYDELVERSRKLIQEGKPNEMVTDEFSALKIVTTMTKGSKADIFKLEDKAINKPLSYKGNMSIIVGSEDHCNKVWGIEYLNRKMEEDFINAKLQFSVISNADHMFKNHEKELARYIVETYLKMN